MFRPYCYTKGIKVERLTYPNCSKGRKFPSLLLIFSGGFILFSQIILPSFQYRETSLIVKPVPQVFAFFEKPKSRFAFSPLLEREEVSPPPFFYLSIPKLRIEEAIVETNSSGSPDESLIHLQGSSLPGEPGNAFIYGHSVLPWFFSPEDYKTIFANLPNLEEGDEIIINFADQTFVYLVDDKAVVSPEEAKSYHLPPTRKPENQLPSLTLMTCVPPGLKTKRLLIFAQPK